MTILKITHPFLVFGIGLAQVLAAASESPAGNRPVDAVAYYPAVATINDPEKRCVLDIRIPENQTGFATLVWFHGGGLTGGQRGFPQFKGPGIALIAAGYRLSPQAKCPEIIEDAAAAVAWTVKHIGEYGGDPQKVFVGGHSAGGYLTAMVGMDPKWLAPHGLTPNALAGLIPVSGQMTTHFRVKEVRGISGPSLVPVIDEFAPLHFVAKELPPICLITGDRRIEWPCRVEENDLLATTLRKLGHPDVEFHEIKDLDHATAPDGAATVMPAFIGRLAKAPAPDPGHPEPRGNR